MGKKLILGDALTEFIESLEDSNDDEASQLANEARYTEIIESYQDSEVLASATPKQVVSAFYTLAEFLQGDLPGNYEDLMPAAMDSFYLVGEDESAIYEAFEIVGEDKFPASEIDNLITRQNRDSILEVGATSPRWLRTKVLKRQQYLDLWAMNLDTQFQEGYHIGLAQNPMTPKKLLLEASESGWYEVRRSISLNPKADEEILKNLLIRGDYIKTSFKDERISKKLVKAYDDFMSSSSLIKTQYGYSVANHVVSWLRGEESIMPTEADLYSSLYSVINDGGRLKIEKFFIPGVRDNSILEFNKSASTLDVTVTNIARVNSPGKLPIGSWKTAIQQPTTAEVLLRHWLADSPEINTVVQWTV
jgi:hypothetical protein